MTNETASLNNGTDNTKPAAPEDDKIIFDNFDLHDPYCAGYEIYKTAADHYHVAVVLDFAAEYGGCKIAIIHMRPFFPTAEAAFAWLARENPFGLSEGGPVTRLRPHRRRQCGAGRVAIPDIA